MDSIKGWKIFGKKKFHEIPKNTTWICHSSSTIYVALPLYLGFPGGSDSKVSACNAGDMVWSMDQEDLLEKEMATHSSILAWRIPWTEEPGKLQYMGSQRVRHDWTTNITLLLHYIYNCLHGVFITFSSVAQSCLILCNPIDCNACQASLSITNSWSLLKLMSIESVMPSNHLMLCHPLFLPSVFALGTVNSLEMI